MLRVAIDMMARDWGEVKSKEEYTVMLETAKISRIISVVSTIITNSLFIAFVFFKVSNLISQLINNQLSYPDLVSNFFYIILDLDR